ncbi:MAG: tRNA (N(6)-L-threonylcarbamoyladenosine(37)-C(2))-methylthiotransferase MtaB [Syntrophobacteraceae bacterium CG07_land_8_20_14_0_80_61_8]|nr:MAG: tRNA (N(6)-L-threonylcarbamoyladenosine(37)-C(2))-methylthiotransferase MtaB [Syntrophobacteraceae bacterium CG07_land_8_20_14_0_80_61_8]
MSKPTVALETLGCKVNQYESSHLLERLHQAGHPLVAFRERADIYLVNSCAVTARAGTQTRQLLHRAQRLNPRALIVVMGCDAQLEPDRFVSEALATHVLGTREKLDLIRWLETPADLQHPLVRVSDARCYDRLAPLPVNRMLGERTRAFLKIQDGCDAFCSYCVVPMTRGCGRSLPAAAVLEEFDRLVRAGYREVVLTGIHLGQWGRDLTPEDQLSRLLTALETGPGPARIRLSSLEPTEWNPAVLAALAASERICPHFHVPLQSGDRDLLAAMGRPYAPELYLEIIGELHRIRPQAAIGADVMVGFPGETADRFRATTELIERTPVNYLHVFPFSPRPGTAAARRPGRVTGQELKARAKALRELGERKRRQFHQQQLGRWVQVLVENRTADGWSQGTSENYLPVRVRAAAPTALGEIVQVRLESLTPRGFIGRIS